MLNLETEIKQHYVLVSYISSECYAPISKISICLTLSIEGRNETLTKKGYVVLVRHIDSVELKIIVVIRFFLDG
jgi:hypothetical protein